MKELLVVAPVRLDSSSNVKSPFFSLAGGLFFLKDGRCSPCIYT
jgi:hypothetical protein